MTFLSRLFALPFPWASQFTKYKRMTEYHCSKLCKFTTLSSWIRVKQKTADVWLRLHVRAKLLPSQKYSLLLLSLQHYLEASNRVERENTLVCDLKTSSDHQGILYTWYIFIHKINVFDWWKPRVKIIKYVTTICSFWLFCLLDSTHQI